jgi:hypothetical protein
VTRTDCENKPRKNILLENFLVVVAFHVGAVACSAVGCSVGL